MSGGVSVSWRLLAALGGLILCAGPTPEASSQTRPTPSPPSPPAETTFPRVSPTLQMLERLADDGVPDPPFDSIDGAERVDVLIRERCPGSTRESHRFLEPADPSNSSDSETGSHDGRVVAASVEWEQLDALADLPCVIRVEPARLPGDLSALEKTTARSGVRAVHYRPDSHYNGADQTITLLDSPVDLLHPAFFRPDGGRYRWLDVDGDEEVTPGTDAVDLDRDGEVDHNETLRVVDATTVVDVGAGEASNDDGVFQAGRDWLYADLNGDGRRNAGRKAGFREFDPAYAEPTFVADDVDRDGTLEAGERLYRLDTCKIERLVGEESTYVRGEDLIEAIPRQLPSRALHGTGVAGILVGGQLGFHRRVGVAPRADLVVVGYPHDLEDQPSRHLQGLQTAIARGSDVFLSEWTNPFLRPLDGSSNLEAAMGDARDEGVAQVVPVGNLNRSGKHLKRRIPADDSAQLVVEIPETLDLRDDAPPPRFAFGTLQWRADTSLDFAIAAPESEPVPLADGQTAISVGGAEVEFARDRTPAGTRMLTVYLRVPESSEEGLAAGRWQIVVENSGPAATLFGRITDDETGWEPGIGWAEPTSDESTFSYPAGADAAIGVGAHVGRRPTGRDDLQVGTLRGFSGRGPRIDGERAVDLTAPDNPYVPVAATTRVREAGWERGWYHLFGGTSGAAPHVAGSLALVAQAHPQESPDFWESRLIEHSARTNLTPDPDAIPGPGWGYGQLRVHRALFGAAPPTNAPPEARLTIEPFDSHRVRLDATASSDPDGDRLEYRFDIDHDGDWETDWRAEGHLERSTAALGEADSERLYSRLEIRDSHGARAGALAKYPPSDPGGGGDAGPRPDALARTDGRDPAGPPSGCTLRPSPAPFERIPARFGLLAAMCLLGWLRSGRPVRTRFR